MNRIILIKAFNYKCAYCSKNLANTLDHIIPLKLIKTNLLMNMLPACKTCNSAKSHISIYEFCSHKQIVHIDNKISNLKGWKLSNFKDEQELRLFIQYQKAMYYASQNKSSISMARVISFYFSNKVYLSKKRQFAGFLILNGQFDKALKYMKNGLREISKINYTIRHLEKALDIVRKYTRPII